MCQNAFFAAIHCELLSSFRIRVRVEHSLLLFFLLLLCAWNTKMGKIKKYKCYGVQRDWELDFIFIFKGIIVRIVCEYMRNVCKSFACL